MSEVIRTQAHRTMEIATPLGDDKLMLLGMHGTETLGRLFHFEVELMAEAPVNSADILGKNVTIRLNRPGDKIRYFNGYISRFLFLSLDESNKDHKRLYYYRAVMVPWAWFLSRFADCRIFQNKSIPDIIKKIFSDHGFSDFKDQLTGSYSPWVYCVQYRETDFNFISRLMENEGIYYYFEHENGKHYLVLCDAPSAHKPAPDYADLHFDKPDTKSTHDAFLWNWTLGTEITPNKYALTDYNPLQPKTDLSANMNVEHSHDPDTYEIFDYPGGYDKPDKGRHYANTRIEEVEAQYIVCHGASSARGIFAGATFTLQDHPAYDPEEYLLTSITYQLENDDLGGGTGRASGGPNFQAQVTCIPHKYEFRSQRLTPKPIVQGPQTAVVVGPSGEEIHCNDQSQVKVKFFWDRDPKKDETSSCWIRVSQAWAGLTWGAINIPRIGQEVIVEFLEGDPDRPIITGRVYNGVNMPPYALPTHQTITTFKSNSSKGGGGFNEIRFEDKKGEEQIFVHGEKNLDIRIKNDRFESIGNNRHLVVEKDKFEHVKNKRHELVDVDHIEEITNDRHLKVGGKEAKEVVGSKSLRVKGDVIEDFVANHSEVVLKDYYLNADNIVIEGNTKVTIKVKTNSITIDASGISVDCKESGATLETTSQGDSTLKSSMNMNIKASMNAAIEGSMNADFKAGMAATLKGGATVEVAGPMATLKGDATTTVKGGVVMIN